MNPNHPTPTLDPHPEPSFIDDDATATVAVCILLNVVAIVLWIVF